MAAKFIINGGMYVSGHVEMHEELARDHSETKGGGYFFINREENILWLYGQSIDFGKAKVEDIQDAFDNGYISHSFDEYEVRYTDSDYLGGESLNNYTVIKKPNNDK